MDSSTSHDPEDGAQGANVVKDFLITRGLSEPDVARALENGTLPLLVLDKLLFPDPGRYSEADLLSSGTDPELPRALWRAMGFPAASGGEAVFFQDDLNALHAAVEGATAAGLSEAEVRDALVRPTRVMSAAMSRIAEQMTDDLVDIFHQMRQDGVSDLDTAEFLIGHLQVEPVRELLWYLFRRQYLAAAWRRLADPSQASRSPQLSVGFIDLVRFAALSEKVAEDELESMVVRFAQVAHDAIADQGGHLVKMIGDAVMFTAEDPATATRVALELVEAYSQDDLLPPARAGLAFGAVLARDGDYFGPTVNLASRIVEIARPSTVVVADSVRTRLGEATLTFSRLPPKRLKGIGQPTLWAVHGTDSGGNPGPLEHGQ